MIEQTYLSLNAFYNADRRRLHSRERDVGLAWRGEHGTTFRAAWVRETGEVYLFRHGAPTAGGGRVDLLARRFGIGELLTALSGYREVCGRPGSLAWFLDRTAAAPTRPSSSSRRSIASGSSRSLVTGRSVIASTHAAAAS
jgi:hypothetical protein